MVGREEMEQSFLSVKNVSKNYGTYKALDGINLELTGGKIVGLCGPNGAGKTTLIKSVVGLLRDFSGSIDILDYQSGGSTNALISYLPDVEHIDGNVTGHKISKLYKDIYPDFDPLLLNEIMTKLGLTLDMPVSSMSKGMREKFQLSVCLSRRAKVYIFDEPIAGVDPASRDSIIETILNHYTEDALVIIATHLIADIESVLDEVVFLKDGKVELHRNCDELREERGSSINDIFREVFKW